MAELGLYNKPRHIDVTQSPNYVGGIRNMEYVSSNYSNAYRLPTHQMKTSADNTLLSTVNPPRSVGSRSARNLEGEGVSRRHNVDEARSQLADEDRSKYSRTPTRTTQQGELRPAQPKRNVEAEFHAGQRAANYKYRADDTLFPTNVNFSPGKNRVAHNETVSGPYFDDKIDPTTLANIANYAYGKYRFIDGIYGKDWMHNHIGTENRDANRRLAEQKVIAAGENKRQEMVEDVRYLNNLAEIEERKAKEEDMRREYRKQIDEYHLSLARPGENKVEKAQR